MKKKTSKKNQLRFSVTLRGDILEAFLAWKTAKETERGMNLSYQNCLNEMIHRQAGDLLANKKGKK